MKRYTIFIIIALVLSIFAACGDDAFAGDYFSWDKKNTELHVPLSLLMIVDMQQTLEIAKYPHKYYEKDTGTNWYLGDQPNKNRVYEYFAISYIVNTAIVYILPGEWSHGFQTVMTLERVYIVAGNHSIGIKIKLL